MVGLAASLVSRASRIWRRDGGVDQGLQKKPKQMTSSVLRTIGTPPIA